MKTLIKNVYALLPDGTTPLTNIMIDRDKIASIGEVPEDFRAAKVIDGKDKFAVPGFVNAHTHASMTLFRSYADDMNLMDWLNNMIWPAEAKMQEEDIYWGAMLAAVEMIEGGTTTFADMYGRGGHGRCRPARRALARHHRRRAGRRCQDRGECFPL